MGQESSLDLFEAYHHQLAKTHAEPNGDVEVVAPGKTIDDRLREAENGQEKLPERLLGPAQDARRARSSRVRLQRAKVPPRHVWVSPKNGFRRTTRAFTLHPASRGGGALDRVNMVLSVPLFFPLGACLLSTRQVGVGGGTFNLESQYDHML